MGLGRRTSAHLARSRLGTHGTTSARAVAGTRVVRQAGAVASESDLGPAATRRLAAPQRLGAALLVRGAFVRAALVPVVVVGVVVAQTVDVIQREERPHRGVGRVCGAAVAVARVLGLARCHLGLPPEVLPDLVDEGVQEPINRVARGALDVGDMSADEGVDETVVRLELRVLVHRDVGVRELVHHIGDVGVGKEVLARRGLGAGVSGRCVTKRTRERVVLYDVFVAGALQGIASQTRPEALAFRKDAPAGEVTNVHIAVVVAEVVCGGEDFMSIGQHI